MTEPIMQKLKEHDQKFLRIENRLETLEVNANVLRDDVKVLKDDVKKLDGRVHKMGIQFEDHTAKLNQVLEIVLHTNRMLAPRQEIEGRFENHENRLSAIEYSMRKSPENTP